MSAQTAVDVGDPVYRDELELVGDAPDADNSVIESREGAVSDSSEPDDQSPPAAAAAPEITLKAQPSSCATLRQGQPCFVKFSLSWESDQPVTVCLVSEQNEAGACWENELSGEFRKNMYLSETTQWDLQSDQGELLGRVQVRVAWVYRSSRVRRNWRLF